MDDRRQTQLMARIVGSRWSGPLHERLCNESVSILSVSTAALILMSEDEAGALVVSSDQAAGTDEDLLSLDEGPCFEAYQGGAPVMEADLLAVGERWPRFVKGALAADVRAVFALPLQLGAIRLGIFYLNRREPGMLSPDQLADAFVLAEMATIALLERQSERPAAWPSD